MSPFDTNNYMYSPYIGLGETVYGLPDNDKDGVTDAFGIHATLDGATTWIVEKTSNLNGLSIAAGAVVTAPEGYDVTMTVDGIETVITAGDYTGEIILAVN